MTENNNIIFNLYINDKEELEVSVRFMRSIKEYIVKSEFTTMNGFIKMLNMNINYFLNNIEGHEILAGRSNWTFKAISDIFNNFLSKEIGKKKYENFEELKKNIVNLCNILEDNFRKSKQRICNNSLQFVKDGDKILINGYSKSVINFIRFVSLKGIKLFLYITESLPEAVGIKAYEELKDLNLDIKIISDSSISYFIEKVNYTISGAEVITENGGIINRIGTYTIGICSKILNKPFYVLAENFKFLRVYPYNQSDILIKNNLSEKNKEYPYIYQSYDFTPSEYITYIFTDSKILRPNNVSDEIIQLFDL